MVDGVLLVLLPGKATRVSKGRRGRLSAVTSKEVGSLGAPGCSCLRIKQYVTIPAVGSTLPSCALCDLRLALSLCM